MGRSLMLALTCDSVSQCWLVVSNFSLVNRCHMSKQTWDSSSQIALPIIDISFHLLLWLYCFWCSELSDAFWNLNFSTKSPLTPRPLSDHLSSTQILSDLSVSDTLRCVLEPCFSENFPGAPPPNPHLFTYQALKFGMTLKCFWWSQMRSGALSLQKFSGGSAPKLQPIYLHTRHPVLAEVICAKF